MVSFPLVTAISRFLVPHAFLVPVPLSFAVRMIISSRLGIVFSATGSFVAVVLLGMFSFLLLPFSIVTSGGRWRWFYIQRICGFLLASTGNTQFSVRKSPKRRSENCGNLPKISRTQKLTIFTLITSTHRHWPSKLIFGLFNIFTK